MTGESATGRPAPRAVLMSADLLFGSKVSAALIAAGCEAVVAGDESSAERALPGAKLLVVDLSEGAFDACAWLANLRAAGMASEVATLGYYQHVDDATRQRALAAGFDRVVPRSKLFREGAELVRDLLHGGPGAGD